MLAHGWCRRSRFCYNLWASAGFDPSFSFRVAEVFEHVETDEFLEWALALELNSECFNAVVRDRSVFPDPRLTGQRFASRLPQNSFLCIVVFLCFGLCDCGIVGL